MKTLMTLTVTAIKNEVPSKEALLLADALLFSVYGWNTNKVRKMELSSIIRWVNHAKKRMTWGDAFKMQSLLEAKPRKVPLWKKLIKISS